jgi:3-methyl-2-oxobutanoate hydroxymethyltransferase
MSEPTRKLTTHDFKTMKRAGAKASCMTAYDFPFAKICDQAGIDLVIVGGSLGMVCLGYEQTIPVTMDQILHHLKPVVAACQRACVVGCLPFGAYQVSNEDAVRNSIRLIKEGGAVSSKIEGAGIIVDRMRAIVAAGIPCVGHLGVTPQYMAQMGGYKAKGKEAAGAKRILEDALRLQDAGAWAIELECVAAPIAAYISEKMEIPTIGIGSGTDCDIQSLILHDTLGMFERFIPKHSKQFANLWQLVVEGLKKYVEEVKAKEFPTKANTFKIADEELKAFFELVGEPERFRPQA